MKLVVDATAQTTFDRTMVQCSHGPIGTYLSFTVLFLVIILCCEVNNIVLSSSVFAMCVHYVLEIFGMEGGQLHVSVIR